MSDPAALRPGPASCGGVPGSGSALAGWCVVGSDGTGQGTGAVILGEPRRPEVKAGGHPADKNRYIGAVSVGFSSDGKRLRRKSPVTPSRRSRTSSECCKGAQRRAPVFGGIHGPSGSGGLARAWVVGPVGADDPVVPGRRKAADGPAGIPAAAQAIRSGRPIGAGCAERAAVDAVAADRARLPGAGDPARRSRRSGGPERGSAGQATRWSQGQAVQRLCRSSRPRS